MAKKYRYGQALEKPASSRAPLPGVSPPALVTFMKARATLRVSNERACLSVGTEVTLSRFSLRRFILCWCAARSFATLQKKGSWEGANLVAFSRAREFFEECEKAASEAKAAAQAAPPAERKRKAEDDKLEKRAKCV